MATPLDRVCCASFPGDALALLGDLRCHPDVRIAFLGVRVWLFWQPGDGQVLDRVLPLQGVELYERRGYQWHRAGQSLPAFDFPGELTTQALDCVLTPAPFQPVLSCASALQPTRLRLVRDERPRRATALVCEMNILNGWAESATTAALEQIQAARSGRLVLILGQRLPPLAGERFWGTSLLVPLGFRPEPALPEAALREALGLEAEEIALLRE